MLRQSRHLTGPLAACLWLVPVSACGVDVGEPTSESTESSVTSGTKTFLIPIDPRARRLCRDEINRHYCSATAARRASAACIARIRPSTAADPCASQGDGVSPACLRYETVAESCAASAPVYPTAASCEAPRPRSCQFYSACVEAGQTCGAAGYALGYGERYCYAFKSARFSAKGELWRDGVMMCLQEELAARLAAKPATCTEIADFAFASHPACYTQPGRSICFLPPGDLVEVFSTIGLAEALDGRTQSQMRSVVGTCLAQTTRWLMGLELEQKAPGKRMIASDTIEAGSHRDVGEAHAFWAAKAESLGLAPDGN